MTYVTDISNLSNTSACEWKCDHEKHSGNRLITTKFIAAKRNFNKNEGYHICKTCEMRFNNPMSFTNDTRLSKEKRSEKIEAICVECENVYKISANTYRVNLHTHNGIYVCCKCAAKNTMNISEGTKIKISHNLLKQILSKKMGQEYIDSLGYEDFETLRIMKILRKQRDIHNKCCKQLSTKTREGISAGNKGKVIPQEQRIKLSIARTKYCAANPMSDETKQLLSDSWYNQCQDGNSPHKQHKHGYIKTLEKAYLLKNNAPVKVDKAWFDSSYELVAIQLFESKEDIYKYIVHPRLGIKYFSESKQRDKDYYPDFLLFTSAGYLLVEVKPYRRTFEPENQAKENAAKEWCAKNNMKFTYLTEKDMGINEICEIDDVLKPQYDIEYAEVEEGENE